MFGLSISLVYAVMMYLFGEPSTVPEVFLSTTNFLFWWYVVVFTIIGVIVVLVALGVFGGGTILGVSKGILGGMLGFFGGGVVSIGILILFAVKAGCSIGGVHLLHRALTVTSTGVPEWDVTKVVIGGILLVASLIKKKN